MATNNPPVFPTAEEFRMFVCSKSCDIISSGAYKKHIMRCKDNGDPWADSVQASCSAVSSYTDHVKMVVRRAQELPTKELDNVIKESLANSSPPCKRWPGPGTCKITGIVAENCLNIARCSTSVDMHGPGRILVHPR